MALLLAMVVTAASASAASIWAAGQTSSAAVTTMNNEATRPLRMAIPKYGCSVIPGRGDTLAMLVDSYGAANNISIQYSRTLESTDQLLHYLEFALTSKCVDGNCWKTELDLVLVDITWANLLSPQLQAIKKADVYADTMLKQVVEFYERPDGDLFAAPLFLDFGVLLYRKDLLAMAGFDRPPETWAELENMTLVTIAHLHETKNVNIDGFLWPGQQDESLMCMFLEMVSSHGGGLLIEEATGGASKGPNITLNSPETLAAAQRMIQWFRDGVSPPSVRETTDSDVEVALFEGSAIFGRVWASSVTPTGLFRIARPRASGGTFGVAPLPGLTPALRGKGTLGGYGMALPKNVSRATGDTQRLSKDVVQHMSSRQRNGTNCIDYVPVQDTEQAQRCQHRTYPSGGHYVIDLSDIEQLRPNITLVPRFNLLVGELYPALSDMIVHSVYKALDVKADSDTASYLNDLECSLYNRLKSKRPVLVPRCEPPEGGDSWQQVTRTLPPMAVSVAFMGLGYLAWRRWGQRAKSSRLFESDLLLHMLCGELMLQSFLVVVDIVDLVMDFLTFLYIYEHPELDAYLPYYSIAVTTGTVVQGFTILTRLGNLRAIFNDKKRESKTRIETFTYDYRQSINADTNSEDGRAYMADYEPPYSNNALSVSLVKQLAINQTKRRIHNAWLTFLGGFLEDLPFALLGFIILFEELTKDAPHTELHSSHSATMSLLLINLSVSMGMIGCKVMSLRNFFMLRVDPIYL